MAPLTTASRALARSASSALRTASTTSTRTAALSTSAALRDAPSSSFESPFRGESASTKVPDFGKYMSKGAGSGNQLFGYFMVGTLGAISAAGAKSTIQGEFPLLGRDGPRVIGGRGMELGIERRMGLSDGDGRRLSLGGMTGYIKHALDNG